MRVLPAQAKNLKKFLQSKKRVEHVKSAFSLDQFLDTPQMDLLRRGVSLRLRYRRNGSEVYLQYKGPGFKENGLLYRSEFTSPEKLRGILLEESHHDIIQFSKTPIRRILARDIRGPDGVCDAQAFGHRCHQSHFDRADRVRVSERKNSR